MKQADVNQAFSEMNQNEIMSLSEDEFKAIPPDEKRSCYDCRFRETYLSHWCVNKDAISRRGTRYAGIIKCPYWEPKR